MTRLLLDLGMQLLLHPLSQPTSAGDRAPVLRWPTRDDLVRALNEQTGMRKSKAVVEDRWILMADYHMDLMMWILEHIRGQRARPPSVLMTPVITNGSELIALVEAGAVTDLESLVTERAFPITTMLAFFAAREPQPLSTAYRRTFLDTREQWVTHQVRALQRLGLVSRPDLPAGDLVDIITALGNGIALEFLVCPDRFDNDIRKAARLYATGVLAVGFGALVPRIPSSGRVPTLRDVVAAMPLNAPVAELAVRPPATLRVVGGR